MHGYRPVRRVLQRPVLARAPCEERPGARVRDRTDHLRPDHTEPAPCLAGETYHINPRGLQGAPRRASLAYGPVYRRLPGAAVGGCVERDDWVRSGTDKAPDYGGRRGFRARLLRQSHALCDPGPSTSRTWFFGQAPAKVRVVGPADL